MQLPNTSVIFNVFMAIHFGWHAGSAGVVFLRTSATAPQAEDYSLVLSGSTGNQQAIFTHRLPFIIYYLSLIFLNPFRYWRIAVVGEFQKVSSSPSTIKDHGRVLPRLVTMCTPQVL